EFDPGSAYMPFSSQLDFLGNPVPYWYYVSQNNLQKEQIPSKKDMEEDLAEFIEQKINGCLFDKYYEQGFIISMGDPKAKVSIEDEKIEINLNMGLNLGKDEEEFLINDHSVVVKSQLGNLYNSARKIYDYEQETLFLENYAVDTLRLYAPVDGVEMTCSPLVWSAEEVFNELKLAIEANTMALKTKGGDYSVKNKEDEYFIVDISVDENVRFLNSKNWSYGFEVTPSEESIMIAKPTGNQPGLGILGFCYVPYHFIYNVRYPVLVQLYSGSEIFQFPLAVVLQGNVPREALEGSAASFEKPELCEYKNTFVEVNTFDKRLNRVGADISYQCFGTTCDIGKSSFVAPLEEMFPQCVNGYILARAEGYADSRYLYSTTESGYVDIILDKLYELNIDLKLDREDYNNQAIITFVSEKDSKTIVYPEMRKVELSEGQYEIRVQMYRNSSLRLDSQTHSQCMDVPASGIGGWFGVTDEKCFDVEIPAQVISNVLVGGGEQNYYILEDELERANVIEINARKLPVPTTIEQLQDNYELFESKDLDIYFT
ncbi:MAG: hypothetical protein KKF68_02585, partial [Nanoarchaeota archaeon]|nr:hypothetical protein [Nanoarchaeota archaeon]